MQPISFVGSFGRMIKGRLVSVDDTSRWATVEYQTRAFPLFWKTVMVHKVIPLHEVVA